jgi:mono/diheme cytochrome c family protein
MARRFTWFSLLGAVGISTLVGCTGATQTATQPSPAAASAAPATTPAGTPTTPTQARTVSFASDVTPLLKSRCAMCHTEGRGGAGDVKMFDTAGAVQHGEISGKIGEMVAAVESGRMPFSGPKLNADEIKLLKDWQAAGAPNN